jgi:hypothetical protein
MTAVERLHRDIARAQQPMTKGERDDLARLIRHRERVLKAAAAQRSAELLAEFEQQLASIYHWDQDAIWRQVHKTAEAEFKAAEKVLAERCVELGIPARFAPGIGFYWKGRGENAGKDRRNELRMVAKSRIEAIEKAARTKIEMACLDAQTQIIAQGLSNVAAIAFFDALPKIEALMPPLAVAAIEDMLQSRSLRRPV